jgi:hypothetical protein
MTPRARRVTTPHTSPQCSARNDADPASRTAGHGKKFHANGMRRGREWLVLQNVPDVVFHVLRRDSGGWCQNCATGVIG